MAVPFQVYFRMKEDGRWQIDEPAVPTLQMAEDQVVVLFSDPVWIQEARIYHGERCLKAFKQMQDGEVTMLSVEEIR